MRRLSLVQVLLYIESFVAGCQCRGRGSFVKLFHEVNPGSPPHAVKVDGHTEGYQQNQDAGHQQAEGNEATCQA